MTQFLYFILTPWYSVLHVIHCIDEAFHWGFIWFIEFFIANIFLVCSSIFFIFLLNSIFIFWFDFLTVFSCLCFLGIHPGDCSFLLWIPSRVYLCPFLESLNIFIIVLSNSLLRMSSKSLSLEAITMGLLIFRGDISPWPFPFLERLHWGLLSGLRLLRISGTPELRLFGTSRFFCFTGLGWTLLLKVWLWRNLVLIHGWCCWRWSWLCGGKGRSMTSDLANQNQYSGGVGDARRSGFTCSLLIRALVCKVWWRFHKLDT